MPILAQVILHIIITSLQVVGRHSQWTVVFPFVSVVNGLYCLLSTFTRKKRPRRKIRKQDSSISELSRTNFKLLIVEVFLIVSNIKYMSQACYLTDLKNSSWSYTSSSERWELKTIKVLQCVKSKECPWAQEFPFSWEHKCSSFCFISAVRRKKRSLYLMIRAALECPTIPKLLNPNSSIEECRVTQEVLDFYEGKSCTEVR